MKNPDLLNLHLITADRFCLGISLMEIVTSDLYKIIEKDPFPKDFNPYSPASLEFWPQYAVVIKNMQHELLQRSHALQSKNGREAKMLSLLMEYINLDPMKRI